MKRLLMMVLVLGLAFNVYAGQWRAGTGASTIPGVTNASDIDTVSYDNIVEPLDRVLQDYRRSMAITYASASTITVSAGQVVVSNSTGSIRLMLSNSSASTLTWADIDTGSEAASTTYYIYSIAATAASETATFKISTSATSPTGITYYQNIGSFYNDSSSNIDRNKIYDATDGTPLITAIYSYGSSASSYTFKNSDMKFAYGSLTVAGSSNSSISNLPFSSTSTYSCTTAGNQTSLSVQYNYGMAKVSGSSATISNYHPDSRAINWICTGY